MISALESVLAEHNSGKHPEPRADCFACFGELKAEVARFRAALMSVADGDGVIPHDGCHCQSIAAEALDGTKFTARLTLTTPSFVGRGALKGD